MSPIAPKLHVIALIGYTESGKQTSEKMMAEILQANAKVVHAKVVEPLDQALQHLSLNKPPQKEVYVVSDQSTVPVHLKQFTMDTIRQFMENRHKEELWILLSGINTPNEAFGFETLHWDDDIRRQLSGKRLDTRFLHIDRIKIATSEIDKSVYKILENYDESGLS